jgi:arylsulfatase A-like enzyme
VHTTRRSLIRSAAALPAVFLPGPRASAAPKGRPNILLLFPDQHRFDWTGLNPKLDIHTPNLQSLARRGVTFTHAIVPSPLCAPCRAAIASGKEYHRCRVPGNQANYPLNQTTFYSLLRLSGYHVTGCGKLDLHKATEDWGLDGSGLLREWGFSDGIDNAGKMDAVRSGASQPKDPYMAMLYQKQLAKTHIEDLGRRSKEGYRATFPTPLPDDSYCDNWVAQNGLKLIERAPKDKPWFLAVNFTGPHNPMDITRSMEPGCRGRNYPQPNRPFDYPGETHVAIRQNYTAMVENIDQWTGVYVETLRRRGELDRTLIIYSSDHGEMLGDHGRWGKSVPYQPSVGVPLVAAGPGVEHGKTSSALVSLVDLAATFLDYAGVPVPSEMDSKSLRPVFQGKAKSHRRKLQSALGDWRMVWDGRYKLIEGFQAARQEQPKTLLFDLAGDPLENVNLAAGHSDVIDRLKG